MAQVRDRELSPDIVRAINEKTGKTEGTIRKDIYVLRRRFSGLPVNSVAQIYALQNGTSVLRKLTKDEKSRVPNLEVAKPPLIVQKHLRKKPPALLQFVSYQSQDPFISAHVEEINRAYTYHCYTASFILCRKLLENLLTDVIRRKYPHPTLAEIELYYDTSQRRTKDFSAILSNLSKRGPDFGPDQALLERIIQRASQFKDDANDKTHSWYHIVRNRKELDDTIFQDIIEMITKLEKSQFT